MPPSSGASTSRPASDDPVSAALRRAPCLLERLLCGRVPQPHASEASRPPRQRTHPYDWCRCARPPHRPSSPRFVPRLSGAAARPRTAGSLAQRCTATQSSARRRARRSGSTNTSTLSRSATPMLYGAPMTAPPRPRESLPHASAFRRPTPHLAPLPPAGREAAAAPRTGSSRRARPGCACSPSSCASSTRRPPPWSRPCAAPGPRTLTRWPPPSALRACVRAAVEDRQALV